MRRLEEPRGNGVCQSTGRLWWDGASISVLKAEVSQSVEGRRWG